MANKFRGEVSIEVGGQTYPIAMTLDVLGRLATAYGLDTIAEIEGRVLEFRAADAVPTLEALLAGSGHDVDRVAIGRIDPMAYGRAIAAIYSARKVPQEGAEPGPQKRGKTSPPTTT